MKIDMATRRFEQDDLVINKGTYYFTKNNKIVGVTFGRIQKSIYEPDLRSCFIYDVERKTDDFQLIGKTYTTKDKKYPIRQLETFIRNQEKIAKKLKDIHDMKLYDNFKISNKNISYTIIADYKDDSLTIYKNEYQEEEDFNFIQTLYSGKVGRIDKINSENMIELNKVANKVLQELKTRK